MESTDSAHLRTTDAVDWRRAEFVLTVLGFVGFVTLLIRLKTVYGGLPAHPLIIHVPVVLIPVSILGALAFVARPDWLRRYGIALCVCAIIAMSSVFLAMQAGAALESSIYLSPTSAHYIHEHSAAAHVLAIVFVAFTAILILTFAGERISTEPGPTGLAIADRILGNRGNLLVLRALLVILALVSAYYVFRVGDLGAKAVWAGRVH